MNIDGNEDAPQLELLKLEWQVGRCRPLLARLVQLHLHILGVYRIHFPPYQKHPLSSFWTL